VEYLKITALCIGAAVLYGICQDQITARICVEYFTVGHPPIFGGLTDPTLLAFSWGVIATWWVGLILGVPAAVLARIGSRPKMGWRDLRWPIGVLFLMVALSATVAGLGGYVTAGLIAYHFPDDIRASAPFQADAAAHGTAYAVGFVGGVLVWGWIWWRRGRSERRLLLQELERLRKENRELVERLAAAS
jgi:hypothetical protein